MNISHKNKALWWASARCASRATFKILELYDFTQPSHAIQYQHSVSFLGLVPGAKEIFDYSHNIGVPPGAEKYFLMMNIRNPYSRAVSWWYSRESGNIDPNAPQKGFFITFEDFIKKRTSKYKNGVTILGDYEKGVELKKPDLFIRYEHLEEDIKKIPFVDWSDPMVKTRYNTYILKNSFHNAESDRGMMDRNKDDDRYVDWKKYYTEELADLIWRGHQKQFDLFGYDKDSWK